MSLKLQLQSTYGSFSLSINAELPSQGITALFGPSGSGKTRLLRLIAGLDKPDNGVIKFNGKDWNNAHAQERRVGLVFQEPSLFPHLSVKENIHFSPYANSDLSHWIERFRLEPLLARKPETLSGGEKQRVAIVRALASEPELLLMDEPMSALDETSRKTFLPYLEQLRDELEIPMIYVSHSISEVARLADQIVALENGQLIAQGGATEVLTNPKLPLAHSEDAGTVLEATVADHCPHTAITTLNTNAGLLQVASPSLPRTKKQSLRIHIAARDVSIALERAANSSILNSLAATITSITEENAAQALVTLQINDSTLLARITQKSVAQLKLATQQTVYAQIKGIALFT